MPDHSGVTSGSGDHAEMAVPLSQRPQGTTNPASAGQDTGDGKNDLRAEMVEALRLAAQTRPEDLGLSEHEQWYVDFNCVDCDADTLYAVLAHGLAAAGWRPPLPADEIVRTVCTMAGMFSATNRQDMAEWLVDTADAIRRGVPWPKLKSLPADEVEWGYRNGPHEDDHWSVDTEASARQWVERAIPGLRVLGQRRKAGPWVAVPVEPKETRP